MDLTSLLTLLTEKGGSDLHLIPGDVPRIRVDGRLFQLDGVLPLSSEDTTSFAEEWVPSCHKVRFEQTMAVDCSFQMDGLGRFCCHVYRQRGQVALAVRWVPESIPSFDQLGLPPILGDMAKKPRGLVLVTGPTGSGKSTTLAALLDKINSERRVHILTIEDPIEYVHTHKKGLITQREVGMDTPDFGTAVESVFRQDPDVVLLGEMCDLETIEAALMIAETGHLTLATMPTSSCLPTLHRLIDGFPVHQHPQVRARLALVLEGIFSQTLVPKTEGAGRVLALEIFIPTPGVRNLLRDNKISQIYSIMQTGQAKHGMQTMNQAFLNLYRRRMISSSSALARSSHSEELRMLIERTGSSHPRSGDSQPGHALSQNRKRHLQRRFQES